MLYKLCFQSYASVRHKQVQCSDRNNRGTAEKFWIDNVLQQNRAVNMHPNNSPPQNIKADSVMSVWKQEVQVPSWRTDDHICYRLIQGKQLGHLEVREGHVKANGSHVSGVTCCKHLPTVSANRTLHRRLGSFVGNCSGATKVIWTNVRFPSEREVRKKTWRSYCCVKSLGYVSRSLFDLVAADKDPKNGFIIPTV